MKPEDAILKKETDRQSTNFGGWTNFLGVQKKS